MTLSPEDDFISSTPKDAKLAALVDAVMSADGKSNEGMRDRKTHLTMEQALQIARARAFADSFIVIDVDNDGKEKLIDGPLESIHLICDYLENTAVSVQGKGMKQLADILTATMQRDDVSQLDRTTQRVMR